MKIEDLPENAELITNNQDIDYWLDEIQFNGDRSEIGCLFIEVNADELENMWYCFETIPHVGSEIYHLYNIDQDYENYNYEITLENIDEYMPF